MHALTSLRPTRLALLALLLGGAAITSTIAPPAAYARHSPSHRAVLHLGSHGHRVARLQRLLHVPADGIFGPRTLAAVLHFQRRHHLRADGQVGPHTLRRLRHARHARRRHGSSVLHLGSHGSRVARMQRLLHVGADGVFGPATLAAVLHFQRRHHLVADGQVGRHTLRRLHHARRRHRRHGSSVLHLGSHGARVVRMQHLLHVPADGVFGPQTLAAVLHFQRRHHLRADGRVGRHTLRRLHHARRHHHHAHGRHSGGVLHVGSHGRRVVHLQRLLHIPADGIFGPQTLAAVVLFQRRHRLAPDGRVGRVTWLRLVHAPRNHHRSHHRHHHHARRAHGVAERAIRAARAMLGVPYAWGGASPRTGFDCSGLVMYAYGRAGVALPHFTGAQYSAGRHVRLSNLRPGDLVFFEHLDHVGIWLGHGRFIHAPHSGTTVQITRLSSWYRAHWSGATRVA